MSSRLAGMMLGILPTRGAAIPRAQPEGGCPEGLGRMPNIIPMPAGMIRSERLAVVAGRMPLIPPKGRSVGHELHNLHLHLHVHLD